ncbi:hypothetical protein EKL30_03290 [Candidimonas sp. SYP-B2681]|uniref:RT0821/Lpp0805 family surface protein n=1 Tax=Candidimonas sp. SYP-B2681 TaxID=2497686 RepID=UPI000F86BD55|nr:RT0821/Lpp0805 family surface protein [Candidimonas sp. SYP-B2681]RTZ48013.1 hypothetical protein EKL30_03290 [Candidimonas sp. SYP-B2681]
MKWLPMMIVSLAAASSPAYGQADLRFLEDLPISHFKQADMDLLTKALNQALDNGIDGVPVTWENPSAGNSGSITPTKDPQVRSGCRKARVESRHQKSFNTTEGIFCKSDGKWKVLSK